MLGSGGKVTLGTVGMVGRLGSGGNVGFGREGWVVGKVGSVGCGRVGIEGMGGNVGIGSEGKGANCRRWRADTPTLMLVNDNAMKKAKMKQLEEAIVKWWLFNLSCCDYRWEAKVCVLPLFIYVAAALPVLGLKVGDGDIDTIFGWLKSSRGFNS